MKPFTFNPQPNALAELFAKWLPMYVGQARMDDDEAEPFQDPLCELERAISDQPIATMQDFYLHHAAGSCFGTMSVDYSQDVYSAVYAAALAETKERDDLLALINEHIDDRKKFSELLDQYDDDTPEFAEKGGVEMSARGVELIDAIAAYPCKSFEAVMLKGRYLAARRAQGDLSYEEAFAFVESFLDVQEGA